MPSLRNLGGNAPVSFCLVVLSLPSHITSGPCFTSAGIKGVSRHHLLCFSFRLIQSGVAQGGLELSEASVSQELGLKACTFIAWPLRLTSVGNSALRSSGKIYLLKHKQSITTLVNSRECGHIKSIELAYESE